MDWGGEKCMFLPVLFRVLYISSLTKRCINTFYMCSMTFLNPFVHVHWCDDEWQTCHNQTLSFGNIVGGSPEISGIFLS